MASELIAMANNIPCRIAELLLMVFAGIIARVLE
jgi:hypothetical protein